jgi:hypothetical protein
VRKWQKTDVFAAGKSYQRVGRYARSAKLNSAALKTSLAQETVYTITHALETLINMAQNRKRYSMDIKCKRKGEETRKKIYDFIKSYTQEKHYSPTIREIGEGVGLTSTCTIYSQLHKLQEMGVLAMEEYKPRTIRLLSELVE